MSVFTENAATFATTADVAITHERRSTIQQVVELLVDGQPGRARYELARSLHRQARMAGIDLGPVDWSLTENPLAVGFFCDTCGTRLERIPGEGRRLFPCPICPPGGAAS